MDGSQQTFKPNVWAGRSGSGSSLLLSGAGFDDASSLFGARASGDGAPGSATASPRSTSPFVHGTLFSSDAVDQPPHRFSDLTHSQSSNSLLRATLQRSMSTSSQMGAASNQASGEESLHSGGLMSPRLGASPRHAGAGSPRSNSMLTFDALRSASAGDLTSSMQDVRGGPLTRSSSALGAQLSAGGESHGSVGDLAASLQGFSLAGEPAAHGGPFAEDTVGPLPRVSSRQAFAAAQGHAPAHLVSPTVEEEAAVGAPYAAAGDQQYVGQFGDYSSMQYGEYAMPPRGMPGQGPPMYMPHAQSPGAYAAATRGMPPPPAQPMMYAEQMALMQLAQMSQLGLPVGDPGADGMQPGYLPHAFPQPPGGHGMLHRGMGYYGAPPMFPMGAPYPPMEGLDPAFYAAYYARLIEIQAMSGGAAAAAAMAASMGGYPGFVAPAYGGPRGLDGSMAGGVMGGPYYAGMGGGYHANAGGHGGHGYGDHRRDRDRGPRSTLLDEFKNNKSFKFELRDLVGHAAEFAQDQHGSRFIQQKLETAPAEDVAALFAEIAACAGKLMTDVFGNYVVQCFFSKGTAEQRTELVKQLEGRVLSLSLQMYGCRVIQKALEVLDSDGQRCLVDELDGHILTCVHDQNGNHVVQKAIEFCPPELRKRVTAAFTGASLRLAQHPYGCRVVQRILEHCSPEEQAGIGLMAEILGAASQLARDQYGNYVIQHVLERGQPDERAQVLRSLADQVVSLSSHKFASNVMEKCIQYCSKEDRAVMISEVLGRASNGSEVLLTMMTDQYSNFVLQRLLDFSDDDQKALLVPQMRAHLPTAKRFAFGKHIASHVERLSAAAALDAPASAPPPPAAAPVETPSA